MLITIDHHTAICVSVCMCADGVSLQCDLLSHSPHVHVDWNSIQLFQCKRRNAVGHLASYSSKGGTRLNIRQTPDEFPISPYMHQLLLAVQPGQRSHMLEVILKIFIFRFLRNGSQTRACMLSASVYIGSV